MEFTKEQQSFINDRGHNILVSAAAGSGKTAVIVERVIRLIVDEGYDATSFLLVTFTKAAAAEMRDRIRDAVADAMTDEHLSDEKREHLADQMNLIYAADITTIDSFCLNLVRDHFNICDTDPSFRVADEGELKLLAQDVMEEMLEKCYEEKDPDFLSFVSDFSSYRSDEDIQKAVKALYDYAMTRPDPEGYIRSVTKEYEVTDGESLSETEFMKELLSIVWDRIALAGKYYGEALRIASLPGGPVHYGDLLQNEMEAVDGLKECRSYGDLKAALDALDYGRLPSRKPDGVDDALKDRAKDLRTSAKNVIKEKVKERFFEKTEEEILRELSMCLPSVKMLASLASGFMEEYTAAKKENCIVDFSDLEHMALRILQDDEIREACRKRYREIIIDEYQDCNRVQEAIFSLICNGHNYVTVGDVKQSIYSFRDACPALFTQKAAAYKKGDDECSKLITLSKNFRSSEYVTGVVNEVFGDIMTEKCGGALYDESQMLNYGGLYHKQQDAWKSEYHRITVDHEGDDPLRSEARAVAGMIKRMVGNLELENRKDHSIRKCGYGDIVILLRSMKAPSGVFSEVFASEGIPLVFDSGTGYLLSYEIREIINLLSVIDNPRQDIPLAGVMMGYFGGFDPSSAAFVKKTDAGGDLWDGVRKCASMTGDEAERCRAFTEMIDSYRRMSAYMPIHELIERIISDHGYDHHVRAMQDGERRAGNLRLLVKRAVDFEETSFHGLFRFLRYIENMKKYEIDFGEASGAGGSDAVRIMSIHHSKGLEFPVVFVSTLHRKMNTSDNREKMLLDNEIGAGVDLVVSSRNTRVKTLIKAVIAEKKLLALVSEEMRVLYVAMTRAENRLILTAYEDGRGSAKAEASETRTLKDMLEVSLLNREDTEDFVDVYTHNVSDCFGEGVTERTAEGAGGSGSASDREAEGDVPGGSPAGEPYHQAAADRILENIRYRYRYEKSLNVPQKVSVSFIKHEAMEEKGVSIAADPEGDRVVPTPGALRGTAVHTAFENLPLDLPPAKEAVEEYLRGLVERKKISEKERGYIKESDIMDFLKTDIAARMEKASKRGELFREQPFVISVEASEIDPSYPSEDRIMVQGIIDAFFTEGDKVVVVDYKTDRVSDEKLLVERYEEQLNYYERALRQLTGAAVSERVIYSVFLAKDITL